MFTKNIFVRTKNFKLNSKNHERYIDKEKVNWDTEKKGSKRQRQKSR